MLLILGMWDLIRINNARLMIISEHRLSFHDKLLPSKRGDPTSVGE